LRALFESDGTGEGDQNWKESMEGGGVAWMGGNLRGEVWELRILSSWITDETEGGLKEGKLTRALYNVKQGKDAL